MADALTCKIVTPTSTVFAEEASYVGLPGEGGGFGVMRGHEPFVSSLASGVARVTTATGGKGETRRIAISGGYAQVKDDEVIVLADDAQDLDEVDPATVRGLLAEEESRLAGMAEGDAERAYHEGRKAWYELLLRAKDEK